MKRFCTLLFSFCWLISFAQLDSEHWFAPMAARAGTPNLESYLYLSTNETTPFNVEIYNDNTLFSAVQISKGSPQFISIPESFMMATVQNQLFTPSDKGLYVKGPKKFFANYRFTVTNHGEIITSKGLAGLGTTFFAAMAPNTTGVSYVNSTIGVIATEDNTTVTMSGYNTGIIFSDGTSPATRTFTLNKGQSYLLDVVSNTSQTNFDGLIGAKIVADKPISVTNGNFNGIYSYQNQTNNDILMDQSVPIDRLGNNFVVVKGNGPVGNDMEAVLVVATEDNTQLTVNGAAYGAILNEGDYTLIPGSNYQNQGGNHYNMSIQSNNNIYVYELLAGISSGNVYPTGGFNYIPPLSCFLPNKVDEVGFINQIGNSFYQTKLNIITEAGATVTLNGAALTAANGPFNVMGNPNWVTYSVENISGNVTVNSTKSVTAGIAAGSGSIGYGGYFAGFSSVPVISKTGDCFNGILLQVDNSYDSYQWYLNGNTIAGETTFFINPEDYGAGSYTCLITKNNCTSKMTDPYIYTECPPVTESTQDIGSCENIVINPVFTNSTQTIDFSLTDIIVHPTSGTATSNATSGQITYTPNPGLTTDAADTFVYYLEGNGNPADFEYFRVNVNIDVLQTTNDALTSCSDANGNGTFDLTSTNLTPDSGTNIAYFQDAALTIPINNPTTYTGASGTVYGQVTSSFGCTKTAEIVLNVIPSPNIDTSNFNGVLCDEDFDGDVEVNFSNISPQIVNNSANFNIRYYLTQTAANAGGNNNLPNNWNYNTNTTVYVRVDSLTGNCPPAFGQIDFTIGNQIILLTHNVFDAICDNDLDGNATANLSVYESIFTNNPNVNLSFYNTLADAQNGTNSISSNQTINSTTTFYIRFESANLCPNIGEVEISIISPSASPDLVDEIVCPNATTVLDAGTGFTSYLWSNGSTEQTIIVGAGSYYVDLGSNGCVYRQFVTVSTAELPEITSIELNGNAATINVSGGIPPYQYSLDGINYQDSNVFTGLPRGSYTVYVIDSQNCEPVTEDFLALNLITAITPNGDGINDYLNYSDLRSKENVSLEIFDRYGALIHQTKENNYLWDGKLGNQPLKTGTYWYLLKWTDPKTKILSVYSGWILLKNRE